MSKRLRFRFIAVTCEEAFFGPVRRGMDDAAEQLGVDVEFTGTKGVDTAEMVALAREALAQGIDGLAIVIIDPAPFRAVIAEAMAQGVPTVAFNINAGSGSAGNLAGIAQHFLAAGAALGRRAASRLAPGSTVLVTRHDEGIPALDERRDGLLAALAPHELKIVDIITGHFPEQAAERITSALAATPTITAILATGQADTEGAVLASAGRSSPLYIAGFDLSTAIVEAIARGRLDCTIDQQPYTQGFYPVVQLALHARYGIMPADMDAGAALIDTGNVATVARLLGEGAR